MDGHLVVFVATFVIVLLALLADSYFGISDVLQPASGS